MDCYHKKFFPELPEWVLIYFEKVSENEYKCNICNINLKKGGKSLELLTHCLDHITENHKDVYKIHKENPDAPIKFQIEYLHFNDLNEQPQTKESVCDPIGDEVIASNKKDAKGDIVEYILLQTDKVTKRFRKRSWIWKYFNMIGKNKCRCNVCSALISIKNRSTGNLYRHLRSQHPAYRSEDVSRHSSPEIDFPKKETARRIDVDANSVLDETSEKEKTQKKFRSWIWDYCKPITKALAMCNVCNKTIWHGSVSTSNMARHLWTKHRLNKDHWVWKLFEKDHDTYSCRMCDFTCTKRENDDANVIAIRDHLGSEHGIYSGDQVVEEEESSEVDQIEVENNEQVEEGGQKTERGNEEAKSLQENKDSE